MTYPHLPNFQLGGKFWGLSAPRGSSQKIAYRHQYINVPTLSPSEWDNSTICVLHWLPESPSKLRSSWLDQAPFIVCLFLLFSLPYSPTSVSWVQVEYLLQKAVLLSNDLPQLPIVTAVVLGPANTGFPTDGITDDQTLNNIHPYHDGSFPLYNVLLILLPMLRGWGGGAGREEISMLYSRLSLIN